MRILLGYELLVTCTYPRGTKGRAVTAREYLQSKRDNNSVANAQ